MIMDQLPQEVKIKILKQFLFKDFLMEFRRFFRFKKQRNMVSEFALEHIDDKNINVLKKV